MDALAPLVAAAINSGTPLMLAALGLLVNEKSGVINLGAEGMMLMAAVVGFAVTVDSGSSPLGFLAGACAGMALAALFAWLTVWLGANQVATGLALSLFGAGASAYLVVQRHLGSDSLQRWLDDQLSADGFAVSRLASAKGYRVLQVTAPDVVNRPASGVRTSR